MNRNLVGQDELSVGATLGYIRATLFSGGRNRAKHSRRSGTYDHGYKGYRGATFCGYTRATKSTHPYKGCGCSPVLVALTKTPGETITERESMGGKDQGKRRDCNSRLSTARCPLFQYCNPAAPRLASRLSPASEPFPQPIGTQRVTGEGAGGLHIAASPGLAPFLPRPPLVSLKFCAFRALDPGFPDDRGVCNPKVFPCGVRTYGLAPAPLPNPYLSRRDLGTVPFPSSMVCAPAVRLRRWPSSRDEGRSYVRLATTMFPRGGVGVGGGAREVASATSFTTHPAIFHSFPDFRFSHSFTTQGGSHA